MLIGLEGILGACRLLAGDKDMGGMQRIVVALISLTQQRLHGDRINQVRSSQILAINIQLVVQELQCVNTKGIGIGQFGLEIDIQLDIVFQCLAFLIGACCGGSRGVFAYGTQELFHEL